MSSTAQSVFRIRTDALAADPPGGATVTWAAAENTNAVIPGNTAFRIRFGIYNQTSALTASVKWKLQVSKNGGAYSDTWPSEVAAADPTHGVSADGQTITGSLLSIGSGYSFSPGMYCPNKVSFYSIAIPATSVTEFEFGLQFIFPGAAGHHYSFQVMPTDEVDAFPTFILPDQGALSLTEANDALTGAMNVPRAGLLSVTEVGDLLIGSAFTIQYTAALSVTEANDSLTGHAILPAHAALVANEAPDTISAGADVIPIGGLWARLALGEDNDVLVGLGTGFGDVGSLIGLEDDDTLAGIGSSLIVAILNGVEDDDTVVSSTLMGANQWVEVLPPQDTWVELEDVVEGLPVPGAPPPTGTFIIDNISLTGAPGAISSVQSNQILWSLVLNDQNGNFRLDRYQGGAFVDSPIQILRATGEIIVSDALLLAGDPASGLEAATKQYVDNSVVAYLPLAGGTLTGSLTLHADPVNALDASTKRYVDNHVPDLSAYATLADLAAYLPLAGGTLTGRLTLHSDPTGSLDASTKEYVDAHGGGGGIPDAPADGHVYGRQDNAWVQVSVSGATAPPGIGGPPSISGSGVVGQVLTANPGAWTNIPDSYTYVWERNGVAISGATASTYTLVDADGNAAITCTVTAINPIGSASQTTNTINVVPTFVYPTTGLLAIYSTRLVVNGYSGPAIKVRRMWDNTTLDVGFIGSNFDHAAAAAFLKNNSGDTVQGYVETWYDQSGNGNHATQVYSSTNEFRPALLVFNNQAWVTFEGQILNTAAQIGANSDHTIGYVGWSSSPTDFQIPIANFDGTNGWFLSANHGNPKCVGYYSSGGSFVDTTSGNTMSKSPMRTSAVRNGGNVTARMNGSALTGTGTSASNAAPSNGLSLGGYNLVNPSFQGALCEVFIYSDALSVATLNQIDLDQSVYWHDPGFVTPYAAGTGIVQFGANHMLTFGNVLQYEKNMPWTVFGVIQMFGQNINAEVLFTNATPDSKACCYEYWVDASGKMRVRLIHNYAAAQYFGVVGDPPGGYLIDGQKHMIAASYDGSYDGSDASCLSSVKMYVDGQLLTNTLEINGLGSLSIIDPAQNFTVGNQAPGGPNVCGPLCFFQLDNVVRSGSYIAAYVPGSSTPLPPNDPTNTKMRVMFTEGTGTSVADTSASAFTGTITNAYLWVP